MKMMIIICPESRREDIRALLGRHEVHTFSEMKNVTGEGETGRRLGTRLWPGTSTLIFAVLDDEKTDEMLAALKTCARELYPGEGLRAFVLPVEQAI